MPLHRSKKGGLELSTLAEIILILLAAGLIIYIFNYAAGRAAEKTSEKLCRGFNALRFATKIDKGPLTINAVPRACKTIDKKDLPGNDYKDYVGGLGEGAKAELRDMMANCWYMWLEGKQPNIFDTSTTSLQNKCFVCYTFSLQNGVSITVPEFISSLDYPYQAIDSSSRCAPADQGGYCMNPCSSPFSRAISSTACANPYKPERSGDYGGAGASGTYGKPDNNVKKSTDLTSGLKCCIADDRKDECINKGGSCSPTPIDKYHLYNKWACSKGNCYVQDENFVSYLDYVQGTNGAKGGAGFIVYEDKIKNDNGLLSGKKYAVTLISPGNSWGVDTWAWGGATVAIPVAVGAAAYYGGGLISVLPAFITKNLGGTLVVAEWFAYEKLQKSGTLTGYNFIYLSEYDAVSNKCQIEAGVGEK